MAKRRKVGNLLGLQLLAMLVERPMHPYEMATELRGRGKEQDLKIQWGSLYTVVQNLEKHGFIEAAETTREGRRPERTVYQLTQAGHEEALDWLREIVGVPEREFPRLKTALSVLGVLPPDEVIDLIGQRIAVLDRRLAGDRADLARTQDVVPRIFLIETEYSIALEQAEVDWLRGLLAELRAGTLPGMAAWRNYHDTGELDVEAFMDP
ncbi:PadR family transcriptional regulator [Dactylosporangium siamense]|uniref:PadR family transcriptional regulator n=1 Tax=Dactylosporangium siamense TaxID=685454 RepID=A0A919PS46_9ACTN|nr:PadR family transcriptional regulator [Dactylosporangium siamense]GIG48351.1 PadR family transcriptional regulator [Dactylosporangium siamense]